MHSAGRKGTGIGNVHPALGSQRGVDLLSLLPSLQAPKMRELLPLGKPEHLLAPVLEKSITVMKAELQVALDMAGGKSKFLLAPEAAYSVLTHPIGSSFISQIK